MNINAGIFRAYDIRGIAERDFDADFARALGGAYAAYLAERNNPDNPRVGVGGDCRLTSAAYAASLREGLRGAGIDVVDLGTCPTPLVYFSIFDLDLDGAIQVTGSHNPSDHNGFKICVGKTSIHGDEIQRLREIMETGNFPSGDGAEERIDIVERYQDWVTSHIGSLARPVRVVVDAGNATAGPVAPAIYRALGADVDEIYCEQDGRFPNHHPDPTVEENLVDLIRRVDEIDADLGIAFDGDADRIGVVGPSGRVIWGDEILILFARDVLAKDPGATIVSEVKCSQRLYDDIAKNGGNGIMWRAGHSPIKAKMRETHAALGGEMSGHIFFADRYFGYDDAIYAGARLLEIVAAGRGSIEDMLSDLPPSHTTPEIRVDCPDDIKFEVVKRAVEHFRKSHETVEVDGVRVQLPDGWGLIRASNTQPVLVLRFESQSPENLEKYRKDFEDLVTRIRSDLE
jgi:phosphomannomutase/phosphoglucomutase